MANMYPSPVRNFQTPSEQLLYEEFARQLGSDYTVFYSRRWKHKGSDGIREIECDFIIVKEDGGILVVEVKGGLWERRRGEWYANGTPATEDPEAQSIKCKNALLFRLRQIDGMENRYFPIDRIVALPDTPYQSTHGLRTRREDILTQDLLPYLQNWVDSVMLSCVKASQGTTCDRQLIDLMIETFMPNRIVKLRDILDCDDEKLVVLTNQQLSIDRSLRRKRRLTVQGCAGSGKTWMALLQARRLCKDSKITSVLFLCYNSELAKWLRDQTKDLREKCLVQTFNELCQQLALNAGLISRMDAGKYRDDLPALLREAVEKQPAFYDAIIVDEGQIFHDRWWPELERLLCSAEDSYFYIFYDELQRVYDEKHGHVPGEREPIELTVNLRNTTAIHRQVTKFLPPESLADCNSIPGQPVDIGFYDTDAQLKEFIHASLHRLINEGGVSHQEIIILTSNSVETSALRLFGKMGNYRLSTAESTVANTIRFMNLLSFRGMERKVVILCFEDDQSDLKRLLYIAGSRARTKLIIFACSSCGPEFCLQVGDGCNLLTRNGVST